MPQTPSSYLFLFRSYNLKQAQLPNKNEVFIGQLSIDRDRGRGLGTKGRKRGIFFSSRIFFKFSLSSRINEEYRGIFGQMTAVLIQIVLMVWFLGFNFVTPLDSVFPRNTLIFFIRTFNFFLRLKPFLIYFYFILKIITIFI